jgi:hypothetical protein
MTILRDLTYLTPLFACRFLSGRSDWGPSASDAFLDFGSVRRRQIEIPQRSSALLSFSSEAREALAVKRGEFIRLLGGAAAAWSLAARAQEAGRTYRFGFLLPTARQAPQVEAFLDELRLNGFVEGKNSLSFQAASKQPTIIWPSGRNSVYRIRSGRE